MITFIATFLAMLAAAAVILGGWLAGLCGINHARHQEWMEAVNYL